MTDGRARQPPGPPPRAPGGAKTPATWERRLRAAFTERLPYKGAAIFFSLVLWLVVTAEEPDSGFVPVQFQPVMDTSLRLVGSVPSVSAYVVGSRSALTRLQASPLTLHLTVPPSVSDSLVVPVDSVPLTRPGGVTVQVVRFQPDTIVLHFSTETRRAVPVRSALRLVDDFGRRVTAEPRFEPETVMVVGPRRRVRTIAEVKTVGAELIVRDSTSIPVALDTVGLGVRVTPVQVRMRVPFVPDTTAAPDTAPPSSRRDF